MGKLLKTLWVVLLLLPIYVWSLGLGDIQIYSALGQPLDAEVPIIGLGDLPLSDVKVRMAQPTTFKQFGLDYPAYLANLRLTPLTSANGNPIIHITTHRGLSVPYLQFLVDLRWSGGQVFKEYTILLDPRGYQRPRVPPKRFHYPPPKKPHGAYQQSKPYFRTPTLNNQSLGVKQKSQTSTVYGPTANGETLYSIAQKIRPNNSVSLEQTMVALFQHNPQAFNANNINQLKMGQRLVVPTLAQINAIKHTVARKEVKLENNEWQQAKQVQQHQPTPPKSQNLPTPHAAKSPVPFAVKTQTKLTKKPLNLATLLNQPATSTESNAMVQVPANPRQQQLQQELAIVSQQAQTQKQQNQLLKTQVKTLEQETIKLEKELANDSDTIAKLEQQLTEQPAINTSMKDFGKSFYDNDDTDTGFFSNMSNVILTALLGFVALLVLFIIFIYLRQLAARRKQQTMPASPMPDMAEMQAATTATTEPPAETASTAALSSPVVFDSANEQDDDDSEEALTSLDVETGDEEQAIEKIDFYLGYQRYDQALAAIQAAIERQPDELEYRLKMMELLAAQQGLASAEHYVNELPEKMRNRKRCQQLLTQLQDTSASDDFVEDEEDELSSDFNDDALFDVEQAAVGDTPEATEPNHDATITAPEVDDAPAITDTESAEVSEPLSAPPAADDAPLSFTPTSETTRVTSSEPAVNHEIPQDNQVDDDMDFDSVELRLRLLKVYANSNNQEAFDECLAKIPDGFKRDDNPAWQEILQLQNDHFANQTSNELPAQSDSSEVSTASDWGNLSFADSNVDADNTETEVASTEESSYTDQLFLIETYIEMNDHASARDLIDEIMQQGNAEEKAKAKALLDQLS